MLPEDDLRSYKSSQKLHIFRFNLSTKFQLLFQYPMACVAKLRIKTILSLFLDLKIYNIQDSISVSVQL